MNIQFEIAKIEDAEKLTVVSTHSFNTDFNIGGRDSIGGPSGYNSTEFHRQMIKEASRFYKVLLNGQIIGGFWFHTENFEKAYLYRIFIDPKFHNKGIGLKSFNFLFQKYPTIKEWTLRTPNWNIRTPKFYTKIGFQAIEKTEKFTTFSKMNR